jgi:hypothetical protein
MALPNRDNFSGVLGQRGSTADKCVDIYAWDIITPAS